jgi:uncharacterized protein (TIGR02265 family)
VAEKLIFAQTFEGLHRALGPRLSPATLEALRALGVDYSRPLLPAYPKNVFIAVIERLGADLFPALGRDAGVAAVGRAFMDGYGETMVGRAMLAALRMLGPRRSLERLSRSFRTANNFSETRLTARGERDFELWCNEVASPGWYFGIIARGLELAGAKDVKVVLVDYSHENPADGAVFRIRWS